MQTVPNKDSARLKSFLGFLKSYTLFCPVVVFGLVRGFSVNVGTAVHSVVAGCIVSLFGLLAAGISQLSTGLYKQASSSFLYAGVALVWILVSLLLPAFRN